MNEPPHTVEPHTVEPRTVEPHTVEPGKSDSRRVAIASSVTVALLWMAQPPWMLWPLALIALVPWFFLLKTTERFSRRMGWTLWGVSTVYWLVSLQGLRHAHPLMCIPWAALAGYLACYHVLFFVVLRRMFSLGIPLIVAAPIAWVGQEWVRNYLLTGISALMLGQTLADVPLAIQIADLFGTYGVSFVIVMVNVAVFLLIQSVRQKKASAETLSSGFATFAVVLATLAYGNYRIGQPQGEPSATFALIQRSETVEYVQSRERAVEIFHNYVNQSKQAIRESDQSIDVVVWPESMFSANSPWMIVESDAEVPPGMSATRDEFIADVNAWRNSLLMRAQYLQQALSEVQPASQPPHLLVGCGVVQYREVPKVYSGVISIRPDGEVDDWYGKTHLVMFGEYIPIAPWIPGLRSLIPPGMGLATGSGAKQLKVAKTSVAPVICIETAVERVLVNQLSDLASRDQMVDAVVTVTNDGWFDDSSVIDHHLRCAQLVAVGCRRPILSAANNGPTAWIDSYGRVVDRLETGANGAVIAAPQRDSRASVYLQIGDWPARICVIFCTIVLLIRRKRTNV